MAKPEVLYSVGLGRPERRVTFEAKESSVFQITKRSNTGAITAFGEHYCTPPLLGASRRDATGLALPERDQFWQVTLISGGLALRFPLLRAAYTSSRTASMLLSEVVQFSTRGCELGHNGGACAPSRMTRPTPPWFWIARLNKRRAKARPSRASVARCAAGRPAKKTSGSAPAATSGIPSTREAYALLACTSGLKPSAFLAADGRRIPTGMRSKLVQRPYETPRYFSRSRRRHIRRSPALQR